MLIWFQPFFFNVWFNQNYILNVKWHECVLYTVDLLFLQNFSDNVGEQHLIHLWVPAVKLYKIDEQEFYGDQNKQKIDQ